MQSITSYIGRVVSLTALDLLDTVIADRKNDSLRQDAADFELAFMSVFRGLIAEALKECAAPAKADTSSVFTTFPKAWIMAQNIVQVNNVLKATFETAKSTEPGFEEMLRFVAMESTLSVIAATASQLAQTRALVYSPNSPTTGGTSSSSSDKKTTPATPSSILDAVAKATSSTPSVHDVGAGDRTYRFCGNPVHAAPPLPVKAVKAEGDDVPVVLASH